MSYTYDAFGNLLSSPGPTPNNYLYRGEQYDSDLGLYYLRARYYNPQTGRFLSRDPEDGKILDPATLHKYLYANGDPVNGLDPMGREDMFETGAKIDEEGQLPALREFGKTAVRILCRYAMIAAAALPSGGSGLYYPQLILIRSIIVDLCSAGGMS